MSTEDPQKPDQPRPAPTLALQNTPNAERYVLEADAMRRRQMRSALLHGSRRTWREHQRVWPSVVVGVVVVTVIIAGIIVMNAISATTKNEKEKEQEQQREQSSSGPVTPGPTATAPQ